ncbi:EamA family transporter [Brachybacterium sp. YJGR34]|uniref:EamA family transporter n=1 Tax=Brachybacterium sp. YJGR34 TaxID=2059911 RepID=UPI000E0A4CEE|nr:EamA family transporter [Brachybacterium sp. YJGR34]
MSTLALCLVLAAALSHATWNVIAHGMSRSGVPFLWWGALASTLVWAGAIPVTGGIGTDHLGAFALGVLVSGALHVAYMLVLQHGYRVGNLSTVYATARGSGPFLAVIAAMVLFAERPSPVALLGVAVVITGIIGIGLLDRPRAPRAGAAGGPRRRRIDPGVVFGLLTGVAIAAYTIWDAHSVRAFGLSPVAFMVGTTAVQVPAYALVLRGRWPETLDLGRAQWSRILAFGVLSPLAYILVLEAVRIAPVALVAPLREVSVVLVSLFGALVLHEGRPRRRLAAAAVVCGGIALLAL